MSLRSRIEQTRPLGRFTGPWVGALQQPDSARTTDFPSYPGQEPASLVSTSHPVSFETGTGASIYSRALLPAILAAEREVILVTCFWAPSSTLIALRETLEQLARLRQDRLRSPPGSSGTSVPLEPLNIHICFSSRSFFQKLFHPRSRDGYTYPPSTWISQLGLPAPDLLTAGLINLEVKSLFLLPFSVMHPKFLVVDRQRAWLPSCNVSWEPWLEGCVELTGDAVTTLLRFYRSVWGPGRLEADEHSPFENIPQQPNITRPDSAYTELVPIQSPATYLAELQSQVIPTILLPSSHHMNPQFRPFPWQRSPPPPKTPLNCAVLRLLAMAEKKIYIQTPNLTSAAVIDALLEALTRGVNVTIVTSKGMMILEQLLTSGTTTSRYLRSFVQSYNARKKRFEPGINVGTSVDANAHVDLEAGPSRFGSLEILYFHALPANRLRCLPEEPVHSHLKLTMVDEEYAILGSGNMDRASWFTSQELGILFQSSEFVATVSSTVGQALQGRLLVFFDSKHQ